jgi:hypothetical protein
LHVSGACVSLNGQYSMYTLAIDIGNARIKAGHFRQEQLIKVDTFTAYDALERTVSGDRVRRRSPGCHYAGGCSSRS